MHFASFAIAELIKGRRLYVDFRPGVSARVSLERRPNAVFQIGRAESLGPRGFAAGGRGRQLQGPDIWVLDSLGGNGGLGVYDLESRLGFGGREIFFFGDGR